MGGREITRWWEVRSAKNRLGQKRHLFMAGKREELETTMPFHTTAQITLRRAKRAKLIYKNSISAVDSQDLYEFHFIIVFI